MSGWSFTDRQSALRGRHVDPGAAGVWVTRHLNPSQFAQWMVVVCVALALWPAAFGGSLGMVIVAGNSMEPTFELGDVVITWKQSVEVGDTILYRVPDGDPGAGNPVIHRVIGGDSTGWVTQGDNVDRPDDWRPTSRDILGVAEFHLPLAGRIIAFLRSWWVLALMGGLAALLLLWPDPEDLPRGRHLA